MSGRACSSNDDLVQTSLPIRAFGLKIKQDPRCLEIRFCLHDWVVSHKSRNPSWYSHSVEDTTLHENGNQQNRSDILWKVAVSRIRMEILQKLVIWLNYEVVRTFSCVQRGQFFHEFSSSESKRMMRMNLHRRVNNQGNASDLFGGEEGGVNVHLICLIKREQMIKERLIKEQPRICLRMRRRKKRKTDILIKRAASDLFGEEREENCIWSLRWEEEKTLKTRREVQPLICLVLRTKWQHLISLAEAAISRRCSRTMLRLHRRTRPHLRTISHRQTITREKVHASYNPEYEDVWWENDTNKRPRHVNFNRSCVEELLDDDSVRKKLLFVYRLYGEEDRRERDTRNERIP